MPRRSPRTGGAFFHRVHPPPDSMKRKEGGEGGKIDEWEGGAAGALGAEGRGEREMT